MTPVSYSTWRSPPCSAAAPISRTALRAPPGPRRPRGTPRAGCPRRGDRPAPRAGAGPGRRRAAPPFGRGHREDVLQRDVQGGAGTVAVLGQRAGEQRAHRDVGRQVGGQDGEPLERAAGVAAPAQDLRPQRRAQGRPRQVVGVAHRGPGLLAATGVEVEHRAGHPLVDVPRHPEGRTLRHGAQRLLGGRQRVRLVACDGGEHAEDPGQRRERLRVVRAVRGDPQAALRALEVVGPVGEEAIGEPLDARVGARPFGEPATVGDHRVEHPPRLAQRPLQREREREVRRGAAADDLLTARAALPLGGAQEVDGARAGHGAGAAPSTRGGTSRRRASPDPTRWSDRAAADPPGRRPPRGSRPRRPGTARRARGRRRTGHRPRSRPAAPAPAHARATSTPSDGPAGRGCSTRGRAARSGRPPTAGAAPRTAPRPLRPRRAAPARASTPRAGTGRARGRSRGGRVSPRAAGWPRRGRGRRPGAAGPPARGRGGRRRRGTAPRRRGATGRRARGRSR